MFLQTPSAIEERFPKYLALILCTLAVVAQTVTYPLNFSPEIVRDV